MPFEIREDPLDLVEHARVSIAYRVERILELAVHADARLGFELTERAAPEPFLKDYDAEPGNHPTEWAKRFDVARWGLLSAWDGVRRIGGAVISIDTPLLHALEGRSDDLAVLWDLRVVPELRRTGIGAALFERAESWALARGFRSLRVETQNINVPACRFYARRGCVLGAVHRFAYPELPDEIQLLWYKALSEI